MREILNTTVKYKSYEMHRTVEVEEIEDTDFAFYIDSRVYTEKNRTVTRSTQGIALITDISAGAQADEIDARNITKEIPEKNIYIEMAEVKCIDKEKFSQVLTREKDLRFVLEPVDEFPVPNNYMLVLYSRYNGKIYDLNYNRISIPIEILCQDFIYNDIPMEELLEKIKAFEYTLDREHVKIENNGHSSYIHFSCLLPQELYDKVYSSKDCHIVDDLICANNYPIEEKNEIEHDI